MATHRYYATTYVKADGVRTVYTFSFAGVSADAESGTVPYLSPADVKAVQFYRDVLGNKVAAPLSIELYSPNAIRILGPIVPKDREIKIYRATEIRFPLVDYRDFQTVSEGDLDMSARQSIFLAQEQADAAASAFLADQFDNPDAGGRRLVNVAPGVDGGDAVNMKQYRNTLRVSASEKGFAELPSPALRRNKLVSFDNAGKPVVVLPSPGSATDLETRLRSSSGSSLIGHAGDTVKGALDKIVARFRKAAVGTSPAGGRNMGTRYGLFADLVRVTGDDAYNKLYGTRREVQYFACDESLRKIYTIHDNDDKDNPQTIVTRYPMDGVGKIRKQDAVSLPSNEFGHQGLAVEPALDNVSKVWCTYGKNKMQAMRFTFGAGAGPLQKELYTFYRASDGFNPNVSCFDGFSYSGRYIITHGLVVGQQRVVARLFDRAAVLAKGPGDHSQDYVYSIELDDLYEPGGFAVQGLTSDDVSLFGISGGNGFDVPDRRLYKYDLETGAVMERNKSFMVGAEEAKLDGSGISYEPEGLGFATINGSPRLCVGIRSGSSLNPQVYRVYALDLDETVEGNSKGTGDVAYWRRFGQIIGRFFVNTSGFHIFAEGAQPSLRLGANGRADWEIEPSNGNLRPMRTYEQELGQYSRRMKMVHTLNIAWSTGVIDSAGSGSPEGVLEASRGSVYRRISGPDLHSILYIKVTGDGNTGWEPL